MGLIGKLFRKGIELDTDPEELRKKLTESIPSQSRILVHVTHTTIKSGERKPTVDEYNTELDLSEIIGFTNREEESTGNQLSATKIGYRTYANCLRLVIETTTSLDKGKVYEESTEYHIPL